MSKKLRAGQWIGSYYVRNKTTDKYGNKYNNPLTYRQVETGIVLNSNKKPIGYEKPHHHTYGSDPKKIIIKLKRKNALIFVNSNKPGSLKIRSSHLRSR